MIGNLDKLFSSKEEPEPTPTPAPQMQGNPYAGIEAVMNQPSPSTTQHIHQWAEKLRSVAPRRNNLPDFQTPPDTEVLEKALLGVLTVIYECSICKELYKTELLGSDKTELDDILDNVEKTGGQYYTRNGLTFVIQRHQPTQQAVTLR